jgi:hypothetical protein
MVSRHGRVHLMHAHAEYTEGCFACKIRTLNFAIVPGASRWNSSVTNYDADVLPDFPTKEEVMDARSDYRRVPEKEIRLAETRQPQTGISLEDLHFDGERQ